MENSRSDRAPKSKQKSKNRVGRTLLGVATLCLVGLLVAWWRFAADDAVVTIPNPVMPNPNAYDYYVAAGKGVTGSRQIIAAVLSKPSAVPVTRQKKAPSPESYGGQSGIRVAPVTLQQKEALLQQNAGVIKTLRQGFAYEYLNPPVRSTRVSPYAGFSMIARLLVLQNQVQAARGDWAGAADSDLDAIRLGEDVLHGGGMQFQRVGNGCQEMGQGPLWSAIEHLNAAQSRAAAQRLEAIMERHFTYADTIQEEKRTGQAVLQEMFRAVKARSVLADANGFAGENASLSARGSAAFFLLYGKKRVLKDYTEFMDAISAGVSRPYAVKMLPPPVPADPINAIMIPMFWNTRFSDVLVRAHNGILLTALALHAYRLEHGRYPASLTELAPAYMKRLPDDPFAMQGSFAYLLKGQSYVLYSVGPDGKDNDATPIDNRKSATAADPQARYKVQSDSTGDIVAGINVP